MQKPLYILGPKALQYCDRTTVALRRDYESFRFVVADSIDIEKFQYAVPEEIQQPPKAISPEEAINLYRRSIDWLEHIEGWALSLDRRGNYLVVERGREHHRIYRLDSAWHGVLQSPFSKPERGLLYAIGRHFGPSLPTGCTDVCVLGEDMRDLEWARNMNVGYIPLESWWERSYTPSQWVFASDKPTCPWCREPITWADQLCPRCDRATELKYHPGWGQQVN